MAENQNLLKQRNRITPKNDYCFKHIFGKIGNEDITKDLLNSIIDTEITEVRLDYKEILEKDLFSDKASMLDIRAKLNNKIWCDIEMQIVDERNIEKRILYYWSKIYVNQLKKGEDYKKLQKTIVILITDFEINYLKTLNRTLTKWQIRESSEPDYIGLK